MSETRTSDRHGRRAGPAARLYPRLIARLAALTGLFLLGLALAPPTPTAAAIEVGAAEDLVRSAVFADSKAQFELAASAGLTVVRMTALWEPGLAEPDERTVALYRNTARAAALTGIRLMVAVYPKDSRSVPLDETSRAEFASYVGGLARAVPELRSFIVGNEPNLNFFWLPQYDLDGTSAAPRAYVDLLATMYDALKAVSPDISVIGGALSPAGTDKASGKRPSHSPGAFILGMGEAYRALARGLPIMDQFAFHPYGETSKSPPTAEHPNSTRISLADYGKLVSFLGRAFDGTAQPGTSLPLVYDEYGVQSAIPASKHGLYTNQSSPGAADAIDEATQALYYRQALQIAACQPNVKAFLIFHTVDEPNLRRWQSGLFYPDLTPKTSFALVRRSVLQARGGKLTSCSVEPAPIELLELLFPQEPRIPAGNRDWRILAGCASSCVYAASLVQLPAGEVVVSGSGFLSGGAVRTIKLRSVQVPPGLYRLTVRLFPASGLADPIYGTSRPLKVG